MAAKMLVQPPCPQPCPAQSASPESGKAVAYVELPALPSAPFWARRHAEAVLGAWDVPAETTETAVLLVSELVTNACAATARTEPRPDAPGTIVQTLLCQPGRIVIAVDDCDPDPPVITDAGPDAESGRGLILVQALSREWSYFFLPCGGKVVYCVLSHVMARSAS